MTNPASGNTDLRNGAFAVALLAFIVAAGCDAQGGMTNLWRDPAMVQGLVHKVYVVAIRKDPVRRRAWEDAFTEALAARGVDAVASYRRFGEAAPDTQQVIDAVKQGGYDAVLVSSRLPNEPTSRRVPGELRQEQVYAPSYHGYQRFHLCWVTVREPGYIETDTIVRLQTDLWSTAVDGGHLAWSGTLSTLESVSGRTAKRAVDRAIMPELTREGVVPAKTR